MDRYEVRLTPEEFEKEVQAFLLRQGCTLSNFQVQGREKLSGYDGTFEIDITARFEFLGADFLVLIECKQHRNPIKRDLVQILNDRIHSLNAQKGMLFSTTSFQAGAVRYAKAHKIALIQVLDSSFEYQTRTYDPYGHKPKGPPYVPCLAGSANTRVADDDICGITYMNLNSYGMKPILDVWEGKP